MEQEAVPMSDRLPEDPDAVGIEPEPLDGDDELSDDEVGIDDGSPELDVEV
jgi:hypothetical protein